MTTPTTPARRLETERDAAAYLNVSHRTLQAWRLRGGGPRYLKLGAAVRYDRADLDAWLDAHARANTAGGAA